MKEFLDELAALPAEADWMTKIVTGELEETATKYEEYKDQCVDFLDELQNHEETMKEKTREHIIELLKKCKIKWPDVEKVFWDEIKILY